MGITAVGTGSGLDINSIVSQLMTVERAPLTKLESKIATNESKISAFGILKSNLASLQSATANLLKYSNFNSMTTTSSNDKKVTAVSTNDASAGTYTVDIYQLASAQKLTSNAGVYHSSADVLASASALATAGLSEANIKISFGSVDGTSFDPDSTQTAINIAIPSKGGDITLNDVKNAINNSGSTLSASIIRDKDNSARLVIANNVTGETHGFKMELTAGAGVGTLDTLNFDPTTSTNFSILKGNDAQNAKLNVNGLDIEQSSNIIKDVIEGTTLTLKQTTLATAGDLNSSVQETLTVKADTSGVAKLVDQFVTAYNNVHSQMVNLTKYTSSGTAGTAGTASILTGDSTTRSIDNLLRTTLNSSNSFNSIKSLSALGVSFQKNGSMSLDSAKLAKVVADNPTAIAEFFGAYDSSKYSTPPASAKAGLAYIINDKLSSILGDNGLIDSKIEGLNSQITSISKQKDALTNRLELVQARYLKQYNALDTSLASMKSVSASLAAQLANLG